MGVNTNETRATIVWTLPKLVTVGARSSLASIWQLVACRQRTPISSAHHEAWGRLPQVLEDILAQDAYAEVLDTLFLFREL